MLRPAAALMVAVGAGTLLAAPSAVAAGGSAPCKVVDSTGQCLITAVDPGRPGGPNHKPGPAAPASPPPPFELPTNVPQLLPGPRGPFAPAPPQPQAPAAPAPAPAQVAQQAVQKLTLPSPVIRLSAAQGRGFVGVPVWIWSDPVLLAGPLTATATAGAVTVTATAQLQQVEWSMGPPGALVSCVGPGTPWQGQPGPSPDCGYTYQLRSLPERTGGTGRWPITATAVWVVTWQGGGAAGQQTLQLTSQTSLAVGEVQVLVDGGGG